MKGTMEEAKELYQRLDDIWDDMCDYHDTLPKEFSKGPFSFERVLSAMCMAMEYMKLVLGKFEREEAFIKAYRANPELQIPVERILGVKREGK